jgi:hypothetical protein
MGASSHAINPFPDLEDAATVRQSKAIICCLRLVILRFMQVPGVIDVVEAFDLEPTLVKHLEEVGYRENPMRIELEPLPFADRDGEIENAADPDHPRQSRKPLAMPVVVNRITVAAEAEMLQRMKTGERVGIVVQAGVLLHDIDRSEVDIASARLNRADIQHFDLAKDSNVRDEPVDARAHIHVASGACAVNELGYEKILVEILTARHTSLLVAIGKTGAEVSDCKCFVLGSGALSKEPAFLPKVPHQARPNPYEQHEINPGDPSGATNGSKNSHLVSLRGVEIRAIRCSPRLTVLRISVQERADAPGSPKRKLWVPRVSILLIST